MLLDVHRTSGLIGFDELYKMIGANIITDFHECHEYKISTMFPNIYFASWAVAVSFHDWKSWSSGLIPYKHSELIKSLMLRWVDTVWLAVMVVTHALKIKQLEWTLEFPWALKLRTLSLPQVVSACLVQASKAEKGRLARVLEAVVPSEYLLDRFVLMQGSVLPKSGSQVHSFSSGKALRPKLVRSGTHMSFFQRLWLHCSSVTSLASVFIV